MPGCMGRSGFGTAGVRLHWQTCRRVRKERSLAALRSTDTSATHITSRPSPPHTQTPHTVPLLLLLPLPPPPPPRLLQNARRAESQTVRSSPLLARLVEYLERPAMQWTPMGVANVLWAQATLGHGSRALVNRVRRH